MQIVRVIKITGDRQTGVLLSLSLFDLNKFQVKAHLTPVKHPLFKGRMR